MMNDKQKGSVWDGIKFVFCVIDAVETIKSVRSRWDEFVQDVMMVAACAAVCGLWYVMVFVFHW